jgi:CheY-like chemotaxis protein
MPDQVKAVAFDLDAASMVSLRAALPEWEIEMLSGATTASLTHDWNPGEADLLVLNAREDVADTLGLCRFLTISGVFSRDSRQERAKTLGLLESPQNQVGRANAPLLLLVASGRESLVRAALEAGADSCLVLPVHAKEVARMLAGVRQANRPGRHTLNLDRAQTDDRWRDDGGQG